MQQHRHTRLTALTFGIAGALTLGQVQASGFQIKENSVKSMGSAFAGAGVREDDSVGGRQQSGHDGALRRHYLPGRRDGDRPRH